VDSATEVRYGGVIVGRSPQIRDRSDTGAFLLFSEPLPVGTPIAFKLDDKEQHARVTEVVESADASAAGMRVRFVSAAERSAPAAAPARPAKSAPPAAAAAAPEPAPAVAPPPAAAPAPVAAEASQPATSAVPTPVGGEASSASTGVSTGESSAHHTADPNAPHHDGEGGRRRRRRK
jgi:hypothetical protein